MREPAIVVTPRPQLRVGDRIKLADTRLRWTVRGVTTAGRFAILTKPFNLRRTVLYTVVDFDRGVRGSDNYFGLGYETDADIAHALGAFQATEDCEPEKRAQEAHERGESSWPSVLAAEVSYRNHVRLDFQTINGVDVTHFGQPITHGERDHGADPINQA